MTRRTPRGGRLLAALALLGSSVVAGVGAAPADGLVPGPSARAGSDAWSASHDVTRVHYLPGQADPVTDTNHVTVSVDRHTDLQSRERIDVSWTGAHPTGGRAGNPYGETGLDQEYPVVILECRGVDDPAAPADQQVSPDTCWTNTVQERSQSDDEARAVWRDDLYATDADKAAVSGLDPGSLPADCAPVQQGTAYHFTPFRAADGTVFTACDSTHLPPEAAVGSVDPPNEVMAYTSPDGTGSAQVEIRTETENASLGCSHTVACTLVVVPIMGLSCADDSAWCNKTGAYAPGSHNDGTTGAQQAVSPAYWWSASNWRNRFSVPLGFALPPSTCTLLGQGPPVPFYGSELLSQAALQWSPAYCLDAKRFNWQANTMPDEAAFALMQDGTAAAAEVTGRVEGDDRVGYAPTAVSGFGIAFNVDDPTTGLQRTSLKLDARLLAKLLTESYPGDSIGALHPGLGDNPWSLQTDPEFLELNPGLGLAFGRTSSLAAATLLALSTGSGVMQQLTSYLAHDKDAMAFIDGRPDPWGMKVNPAYRHLALPVSTWPLLDTWVPTGTGNTCLDQNEAPYLPKIAAPVSSLRLISQAMLFNWPNVQTACEKDVSTGLFKLGRIGRQDISQRFMLGLVTLGDAARYGLPVASLQASPGHYVAPTDASLGAALGLTHQSERLKPFDLDQSDVRHSATAYPGTKIVYTAARTSGLDHDVAQHVAQFIDVSTSEGQVAGRGNGQLPGGYLPIASRGVTADLYRSAQQVRAAVLAQQAPATPAPTPTPTPTTPTPGGTSGGVTGGGVPGAGTPPGGVAPPAAPSTSPSAAPAPAPTAVAAPTARVSSAVGGGVLPVLLLGALVAGTAAVASRVVLGLRGVR
ncbi:MAG: hypothetical protein ACXVGS_17855 [Oryzihumus sp.]